MIVSHNQRDYKLRTYISGYQISNCGEIVYLGVKFDHKLLWGPHLQVIISQAKQRTAALLSHVAHLPASTATKTLLYTTYIRPILTYGATAWGGASKSSIEPLRRLEREWIRIILGIPRFASRASYLANPPFPLLDEVLHDSLQAMVEVAQHHDNPTIRGLGDYRRIDGLRRRYPLQRVIAPR